MWRSLRPQTYQARPQRISVKNHLCQARESIKKPHINNDHASNPPTTTIFCPDISLLVFGTQRRSHNRPNCSSQTCKQGLSKQTICRGSFHFYFEQTSKRVTVLQRSEFLHDEHVYTTNSPGCTAACSSFSCIVLLRNNFSILARSGSLLLSDCGVTSRCFQASIFDLFARIFRRRDHFFDDKRYGG